MKRYLLLLASIMAVATFTSPAIHAQNTDAVRRAQELRQTVEERQTEIQELREAQQAERTEEREARIQERRDAICERIAEHVTDATARRTQFAMQHRQNFNAIYERLDAFVENKSLEVANADELKAAIEAQQAEVAAAVESFREAKVSVTCEEDSPRTDLSEVKSAADNLKSEFGELKTVLKDYAEAIKTAYSASQTDESEEE